MKRIAVMLIVALSSVPSVGRSEETADGKKSLGGSGEMIQFDLPASNRSLKGIEIHGSRYGTETPPEEMFLVYIMNEDRTEITATKMAPYSLFERGDEKWVAVRFNDSVDLPPGGWVVVDFRAGRTKGVYVSYDSDTDGSHSLAGLPGTKAAKPNFKGDWMIRPLSAE